jgi:hypothetical protein
MLTDHVSRLLINVKLFLLHRLLHHLLHYVISEFIATEEHVADSCTDLKLIVCSNHFCQY